MWDETLDALATAPEQLADRVDWIAKRALVEREVSDPEPTARARGTRRGAAADVPRRRESPRLRALAYRALRADLRYHELGRAADTAASARAAACASLADPDAVERALREPPPIRAPARAAARSAPRCTGLRGAQLAPCAPRRARLALVPRSARERGEDAATLPERVTLQKMAATVLAVLVVGGLGVAAVVWIQRALMFPAPRATQPSEAVASAGGRSVWLEHEGGRTEAWFLPAHRPGAGGALLYAHGNGELIDHWLEEWEPLRDAGLSVLLVEYPGYGRSPGRPAAASIGATMRAAYDWLVQQPGIDAKRVAAHGRSLGGGAVCALAAAREVAALVLESTFTSVADIARGRGFPGFVIVDRFDSRAVVEHFRGPMLILHGEADGVIPVAHARRLHEAAPQSELHTLACGHNDCPQPGGLLRAFLARSGVIEEGG